MIEYDWGLKGLKFSDPPTWMICDDYIAHH